MTDLDASRRSEGLSGRPIFLLRLTYPSLVDVLLLAELCTLGRTEREKNTQFTTPGSNDSAYISAVCETGNLLKDDSESLEEETTRVTQTHHIGLSENAPHILTLFLEEPYTPARRGRQERSKITSGAL